MVHLQLQLLELNWSAGTPVATVGKTAINCIWTRRTVTHYIRSWSYYSQWFWVHRRMGELVFYKRTTDNFIFRRWYHITFHSKAQKLSLSAVTALSQVLTPPSEQHQSNSCSSSWRSHNPFLSHKRVPRPQHNQVYTIQNPRAMPALSWNTRDSACALPS